MMISSSICHQVLSVERLKELRIATALALPISLVVFAATPVAAQWGYSDSVKSSTPTKELRATPAQSLNAPSVKTSPTSAASKKGAPASAARAASIKPGGVKAAPKAVTGKPSAAGGHSPGNAVSNWLDLYQLVSKQPLSDEQRVEFKKLLNAKLNSPEKLDVLSITKYWPTVAVLIESSPENRQAFASLFRSLLRFESRSSVLPAADQEIMPVVLGPERIAVKGEPPLTEEALDAYADMACFMYEQKNPGKTIDAMDNRAIFASVICKKYNEAPTMKDKRAVANFALTWSKFKAAWQTADDSHKAELLQSWENKTKLTEHESDKLIKLVLGNGPWVTAAKYSTASNSGISHEPSRTPTAAPEDAKPGELAEPAQPQLDPSNDSR